MDRDWHSLGFILGVSLFLVILFIGVFIFNTVDSTEWEVPARERVERAIHGSMYYTQDTRTGFCFASMLLVRGGGITKVPCTPEVMELMGG